MIRTEQTEPQPMLGKGRTAEWVRVDPELINWVKSVSKGRRVFLENFDGVSIPCENGCGKKMEVGEQALVIHFHGEPSKGGGQKKDRIFCGVFCQRQNYLENSNRFQRRR